MISNRQLLLYLNVFTYIHFIDMHILLCAYFKFAYCRTGYNCDNLLIVNAKIF